MAQQVIPAAQLVPKFHTIERCNNFRECTYQDFMKCQPLFFRGTEGVVDLTQWFERMETVFRISNCTVENQVMFATCTLMGIALTWWNSHARTVTNEVAYAMTWSDLKKKMITKYCPRNEIKKIKAEMWNLKKMAPRGRPTRLNPGTTPPPVADPTTTTSVTGAQLQAMIDEGVTAVLAARATTRNGDDSHTSGTGVRRNERIVRECTYQDFMKCQPLFFRGTEGVVDLTHWFERMETVFRISNCTVENQVKFATCTLMGIALTWWNSHVRTLTNDC
ncbi:reverse transcriptase domain-containing protein [Tanacetum coccineum]